MNDYVRESSLQQLNEHRRAVESAGNVLANYDYLANVDRFRHRGSGDLLKERALLNLLGHTIPDRLNLNDALYSNRLGIRQYAGVTFAPGQSSDVVMQGQLNFNTWVPPGIEPIEGDATPFLELVDLIFDGDAIATGFFLDAIAALIQKPGTKWAFMILLIGPQGIGKSLMCEMVAELVGRENAVFPTLEILKSAFTGWLLKAYVVVFHELDRMNRETATRIKHWITAEALLINAKNVPEFSIKNHANILACANHDDVANLDADDRRVFAWLSQAEKRDPAYYASLFEWFFAGPGKAMVFDFLLSRDLSTFNPKAAPPRTTGRTRLIENARSEAESFLSDALLSYSPPFVTDLCQATEVLQYLRVHQVRCTDAEVRRFLRQHGVSLGQLRIRGERPCLWAIRNQNSWLAASTEEVADGYVPVFDQYTLNLEHEADAPGRSAAMPVRITRTAN
jgi:hypothetical protein